MVFPAHFPILWSNVDRNPLKPEWPEPSIGNEKGQTIYNQLFDLNRRETNLNYNTDTIQTLFENRIVRRAYQSVFFGSGKVFRKQGTFKESTRCSDSVRARVL